MGGRGREDHLRRRLGCRLFLLNLCRAEILVAESGKVQSPDDIFTVPLKSRDEVST